MRILIFIMFVIMIIIFLNELKNITLSFLKINYLKDVADINIKKHCNNIYCEAETGRFNLAKNSYDLLLPNDNFNTKTYYYTILFVIVLLFIDLMYKFWKYNDLFIPYLSNINGEYFITYLKLFPYILSFLIVFILTVMIIRRYAPTSSKGYKAYFNTDNDVISDDIDTFNINVMLNQSKNIIIIFLILYLICGFLSSIPSVPHDSRIDGLNYFYIAMAYIFILLLCFYMMVNIINITMTFTDNDNPSLKILNLKNILQDTIKNFKFKVLSFDEFKNVLEQKINKNDDIYEEDYLTVFQENKKVFIYINNLIKGYYLDPNMEILDFGDKVEIIKLLKDDNIDGFLKYKQDEKNYENTNFNILCKVIIRLLINNVENNINKNGTEFDELNKYKGSEYNDNFKLLYIKYKKEYNKLKLVINLNKLNNKYKKKFNEDDNNKFEFKKKFKIDFIDVIKIYEKSIEDSISNDLLYENNYNLINSSFEKDKNYTVDISYNSKNKFYENYFKISNGENIQLDYNVGNYQIKNMEGLLSYIIMFIVISLILLLIVYNITTSTITFDSYNIFTTEVISPLFILFIFILFIYIFINYNTKYNLHFINGVFDSSYKRDLTHLNNKIIPFIKMHDNVSDGNSYNYLENYIILNVITSIINGNLKLNFNKDYVNLESNGLNINKDFEKDYDYININGLYLNLYDEMETSIKNNLDKYQEFLYRELPNIENIDNSDKIYYFVANIKVSDKTLFYNNKETDVPLITSTTSSSTTSSSTTRSSTTRSSSSDSQNDDKTNCGGHNEILDKIAKLFKDYIEENFSIDINKSDILEVLKYCFPENKNNNDKAQLYISIIKRYMSISSTNYKNDLKEVLKSYINGDFDSDRIKKLKALQDEGKDVDVAMAYIALSVSEKALIDKYRNLNSDDIAFAENLNIFDNNYNSGLITFLDLISEIQSAIIKILATLSEIDYTDIIELYKYLLNELDKNDECLESNPGKDKDISGFDFGGGGGDKGGDGVSTKPPKPVLTKEQKFSLINQFFKAIIEKYKNDIINIILVCRHLFNHFNFSNNLDKLNNDIRYQIDDSILKYFSFKSDDNGNICPYKFLINIKTFDELIQFKKYLNDNKLKDANEQRFFPVLDEIVKNFLIISAHTKYTYHLYKNIDKSSENLKLEKKDYDILKERLVKLYSLFKYFDSKDIFIDDTFDYTFNKKYISHMLQEYKHLKYNYYLITEYKVQSENITNNYLKNVIKSIYKEINNKNIKFINDSASSNTTFKLDINKNDLAKPRDTILSKANNVIGEGLLINYITNIIIIIIMYNIGNNI